MCGQMMVKDVAARFAQVEKFGQGKYVSFQEEKKSGCETRAQEETSLYDSFQLDLQSCKNRDENDDS